MFLTYKNFEVLVQNIKGFLLRYSGPGFIVFFGLFCGCGVVLKCFAIANVHQQTLCILNTVTMVCV